MGPFRKMKVDLPSYIKEKKNNSKVIVVLIFKLCINEQNMKYVVL